MARQGWETTVIAAVVLAGGVTAIDNGLGRLPPMGWRSWNAYHEDISQAKMMAATDAFVDTRYGVSLKGAGYVHVGLDDFYQECGAGPVGSFHNASGYPLINTSRFPSMAAMTAHAHSIGLKMGWYANNCGCAEHQKIGSWGINFTNHYAGDVQATLDFGFDGIKLDGCGEFLDLNMWADFFNKSGRPMLIENCHWGSDGPGTNSSLNPTADPDWAPFNFFRVSQDITAEWKSVMHNMMFLIPWQPWNAVGGPVRTGPGKWAYADMLEVGNLPSFEEDRTHFGLWVVTSQPLILGHDIANASINARIWPIITNARALAVSQSYFGHPGSLAKAWLPPATGPTPPPGSPEGYLWGSHFIPGDAAQTGWSAPTTPGQNGPLKHDGLCVEVSPQSMAVLQPCSGGANQTFAIDVNGSFSVASDRAWGCLTPCTGNSPSVELRPCGTDAEAMFYIVGGTICSKASVPPNGVPGEKGPADRGYCLGARDRNPSTWTRGLDMFMSIWAKPQANGAVAVLAVNGDPSGANQTIIIDFADVNVKGKATAYDVWNQRPIAGTFDSTFTTDNITMHDSRFFVFTPVTAV